MIRRGGVFDKIGNKYEHSLVMLQCLRLLGEEIDQLRWELRDQAGKGVDFLIHEQGLRIAVQCKTRSRGTWSPSALAEPLGYARQQLDARVDCYRFVSDLRASVLAAAVQGARQYSDPQQWLLDDQQSREKLIEHLGYNFHNATELKQAHALCQRIQVRSLCQNELQDRISTAARFLAGSHSNDLLLALYELLDPQSFDKIWTILELRAYLKEREVPLLSAPDQGLAAEWLATAVEQFRLQGPVVKPGRREIPRRESEQIATYCRENSAPILLVHGPPGCGKSMVLLQAIGQLHQAGFPVLPLRADALDKDILGSDPISRFRSLLGEGGGCLVIDQLDQVVAAGSSAVASVRRLIRQAAESGIAVVIGCRSVDARNETHIHMVCAHLQTSLQEIAVGPLSTQTVAECLQDLGIPVADLDRDLAVLVRNALALSLLMDVIARQGSWQAGTSTITLVDIWCATLAADYGPEFHELLDAIAGAMERDRVLAVYRHSLNPRFSSLIDRLVTDGVLAGEGQGRIRPFHQVITDSRISISWAEAEDTPALLALIGHRHTQYLRHARRIRLVVQRLVDRRAPGIAMLDALAWHPHLRIMVRRSVLLGLADVETIPPALCRMLEQWLDQYDAHRGLVLGTVVRGHEAWMAALEPYFNRVWDHWQPEHQDHILDCCGAAAEFAGDQVARHLQRWQQHDPQLLTRAQRIFWHDPSRDSEALFAKRLEFLGAFTARGYDPDWKTLMQAHPQRARILFRAYLHKTPAQELLEGRPIFWLHRLPSISEIPEPFTLQGDAFWRSVVDWWRATTVDVAEVYFALRSGRQEAIVTVVDIIAYTLANALARGLLSWAEVQQSLPEAQRPQDGWLLLRSMHFFTQASAPPQTCAEASAWLQDDLSRVRLHIPKRNDSNPLWLAYQAIAAITPSLSPEHYTQLEQFLSYYPDPWTPEQERSRQEGKRRDGNDCPNRRGQTAYLLLPALGQQRWSPAARRLYQELERKFHGFEHLITQQSGRGGSIRSVIPDHIAQSATPQWWLEHLCTAPSHGEWVEMADGVMGEFSQRTVIGQLRQCVGRRPQQFVELARALAEHSHRIPADALAGVLGALGQSKPLTEQDADWQAIDDTTFAAIAVLPPYFANDACAHALADSLRQRPDFPWPQEFIDRLLAIAEGSEDVFDYANGGFGDPLMHYRLNNTACIALSALAAIAERQPQRHEQLLSAARSLSTHHDLGRRAAAGALAWSCHDGNLDEAVAIVLAAAEHPLVAAGRDISDLLRWTVATTTLLSAEQRDRAQQCLMALFNAEYPECQQCAGGSIVFLREWNRISHQEMLNLLRGHPEARRVAALVVMDWLEESTASPWLRDYAIELANDPVGEVGDMVPSALQVSSHRHLLDDDHFMTALIASEAVERDRDQLIMVCDHYGHLLPLASHVVALAGLHIARSQDQAQDWETIHAAEQLAGLLTRLAMEAESQDDALAISALDALDAMIEAGSLDARQTWKLVTSAGDDEME